MNFASTNMSSCSTFADAESVLSTIAALRKQEDSGYLTTDYLVNTGNDQAIDVECRDKMAAWSFQVVDFCHFNRETVTIAMSYLDRFLMSASGACAMNDRKVFQLAAMTCLYTAVKIHEPEAMDPKLVSNLSRGAYSTEEIESMEVLILSALQWRVNTPTSLSFVRCYLDVVSHLLDAPTKQSAYDISKYQTELAVSEYSFITTKQSTIAFCALLNSLESMGLDDKLVQQVASCLSSATGLTQDSLQVQNCLYQAVVRQQTPSSPVQFVQHQQSQTNVYNNGAHAKNSSACFATSPRSIQASQ